MSDEARQVTIKRIRLFTAGKTIVLEPEQIHGYAMMPVLMVVLNPDPETGAVVRYIGVPFEVEEVPSVLHLPKPSQLTV